MAYLKFGNTWWGNAWLNAFNDIDYSNRIPRGKSYARNGSVESIEIEKDYIKANVAGRRSTPYRVKIRKMKFTEYQKTQIMLLILNNPFYLSQLASHKLPTSLLDDLDQLGIELFPASWDDMSASCSCPDWAVPCKHIAAVIYLIANEIDKNPFIVFELHGFDLIGEMSKKVKPGNNIEHNLDDDLPNFAELSKTAKTSQPAKNIAVYEYLRKVDFSQIPDMADDILKTLTPDPLFAENGNFYKIFASLYKYNRSLVTKILSSKNLPSEESQPPIIKNITFQKKDMSISTSLSKSSLRKRKLNDGSDFREFLDTCDFADLADANSTTLIFWLLLSLSLHLMKQGAYVPQIIKDDEQNYYMRWLPAMFQEQVAEIIEYISAIVPADFLCLIDGKKKHYPSSKESIFFIISGIITSQMSGFHEKGSNWRYDAYKVLLLFFKDYHYQIEKFEEQEVPATIHLWLSRFKLSSQSYPPVIKIDETPEGDTYTLEIIIDSQNKTANPLLPLKSILKYKKYDNIRYPILKNLAVLGEYIPAVNQYVAENAFSPVDIKSAEFVQVWFNSLPILNILGIKCLIPKALKHIIYPQLTLAAANKDKTKNVKSYLQLMEMLSFNWKIALGDQFVDAAEFLKKVKELSGIVRYKNQYIMIDQKEIEKLLKATEKGEPKFNSTALLRLGIERTYNDVPLQLSAAIQKLLDNLFKVKKAKIPANLNATLREYQERGFHWLNHNAKLGLGSIIADDMGLGKTIQVITLLLANKTKNKSAKPALIVVPTSLLTNWNKEFEKFAPSLNISTFHGSQRILNTDVDAVLTTYGIVRSDNLMLKKQKWDYLIIDEAQNIKNPQTGQCKAVKNLRAAIRIAMTGTPVENSLMEYWSIMDFLNKGLLGSYAGFRKEFAVPIEKERDQEKLQRFLKISSPFILRRTKEDKNISKDLPDKIIINRYCNLTTAQSALYQNVVDESIVLMSDTQPESQIQRKGMIFKLITSLKQICNHPYNFLKEGDLALENSGKAIILLELLNKILSLREKCLIFTQYKEMGTILEKTLKQNFATEPLFLHGGLSRKKRDEMISKFENDPTARIFILSLKAGGTGLNLIAANHVIHYDLWWNPAVENQATDRAFRIGQHKNVNVYRFITEGTFEEKIDQMLQSKKELFDISVKKGESWISELSNADLKQLVSLAST